MNYQSLFADQVAGLGSTPTATATTVVQADPPSLAQARKHLNRVYDEFVAKYGHITANPRISILKEDIYYTFVEALEVVEEKKVPGKRKSTSLKVKSYQKADIFSQRVIFKESIPERANNLEDALNISLNYKGKIDVAYIALLTNNKDEESVQANLIAEGLIFENPSTQILETRAEYLSGYVREKLQIAKQIARQESKYQKNVEALQAVQPAKIPISDISFQLGSTWIPSPVIEAFALDALDIRIRASLVTAGDNSEWTIQRLAYNPRMNKDENRKNIKNTSTYGLIIDPRIEEITLANGDKKSIEHTPVRWYGDSILGAALNNKIVVISKYKISPEGNLVKKNDKGELATVPDEESTAALSAKRDALERDFKRFVYSNPKISEELEQIYNDTFNDNIPREWIIPSIKYFPGARQRFPEGKPLELRNYQKRIVIRAIQGSVGGFHGVGTGKTFSMITTAMELRRLGLARKPMLVVQNATREQFVAAARFLYPNAKILSPESIGGSKSKNALSKKQRAKQLARIATGDWDLIILPHSQFDMLDVHPARVKALISERISEMYSALNYFDAMGDKASMSMIKRKIKSAAKDFEKASKELKEIEQAKKPSTRTKDIARRQERMKKQIQRKLDRRVEKLLYFEDLGIDALLVDEAHEYKRLGFETQMSRVKGIDTNGSKKALAMQLKIQYIYEKVGGERNVSFWTGTPISNTMAEMWSIFKYLKPSLLKKYQASHFDGFAANFTEVEQSFEMDAGGRFKVVNRLSKYKNMQELMNMWLSMADVVIGEDVLGKNKNVSDKDYIRNFDPSKQTPLLKLKKQNNGNGERGISSVVIKRSDRQKELTKVFKKILQHWESLPPDEKRQKTHIPLVTFGYARRATIDHRLLPSKIGGMKIDNKGIDLFSKSMRSIWNIKNIYDKNPGKTQLVFCDNFKRVEVSDQEFDKNGNPKEVIAFHLFREIKNSLISQGIPEEEIAIIEDYNTPAKREKLFADINEGKVRIAFGSTSKMGVGVNVQKKLIALHHLDAPLRPMDYEQRNGRIIRVGNENPEVEILTYGIESTIDAVSYDRLKIKQNFINQIMSGKIQGRETKDELDDADAGGTFEQMSAQLSGSQTFPKFLKAKKELKRAKAEFDFENRQFAERIQYLTDQRKILDYRTQDLELIQSFAKVIEKEGEKFSVTSLKTPDGSLYEAERIIEVEDEKNPGKIKRKKEKMSMGSALEEFFAPFKDEYKMTTVRLMKESGASLLLSMPLIEKEIIVNGKLLFHFSLSAVQVLGEANPDFKIKDKSYNFLYGCHIIHQGENMIKILENGENKLSASTGSTLMSLIHRNLRTLGAKEELLKDRLNQTKTNISETEKQTGDNSRVDQLNREIDRLTKEVENLKNKLAEESNESDDLGAFADLFGFDSWQSSPLPYDFESLAGVGLAGLEEEDYDYNEKYHWHKHHMGTFLPVNEKVTFARWAAIVKATVNYKFKAIRKDLLSEIEKVGDKLVITRTNPQESKYSHYSIEENQNQHKFKPEPDSAPTLSQLSGQLKLMFKDHFEMLPRIPTAPLEKPIPFEMWAKLVRAVVEYKIAPPLNETQEKLLREVEENTGLLEITFFEKQEVGGEIDYDVQVEPLYIEMYKVSLALIKELKSLKF